MQLGFVVEDLLSRGVWTETEASANASRGRLLQMPSFLFPSCSGTHLPGLNLVWGMALPLVKLPVPPGTERSAAVTHADRSFRDSMRRSTSSMSG